MWISPRLKNRCETEKASRTSRSRCSRRSGRRGSKNAAKNATISGIQTHGELTLRPNAPSSPRAICHATCGPVQTSTARPSRSSTIAWAISSPPAYQLTCQRPGPLANARRVTPSRPRSSSLTFGCRAAMRVACTAFRKWSRGGWVGDAGCVSVADGSTAWLDGRSAAFAACAGNGAHKHGRRRRTRRASG